MSCFSCSKYALIFFNFIFWISGGVLLALGIWLHVDPSVFEKLSFIQITGSDQFYLKSAATVMIAVGAIVFIVGFFGCCGAVKESRCMLGVYVAFLMFVMFIEIALGVLGFLMLFLYKSQAEEILKNGMFEALDSQYGKKDNDDATNAWDAIQQEIKCCGVNNPTDFKYSYWSNLTNHPDEVVPYTCCTHGDTFDKERGLYIADNSTACQKEARDILNNKTMKANYVNTVGCYASMKRFVLDSSVVLICVGIGIGLIEIFGVIFGCCLCCQIGKGNYDYTRS